MSNRERIVELLNTIPDYKIGYVLAYIQGMSSTDEEKSATSEDNTHE